MAMTEVMPVYDVNKGDGGFGGSCSWVWILLFILLLGGNGFGFGGGNAAANQISNDFMYSNLDARINGVQTQIYNQTKDIYQGFGDTARQFASLQNEMAQCCCETQRAIDGAKYDALVNTNAIIANNNTQTQLILDKLNNAEIQSLRDKVNGYEIQLSNQAQSAALIAQLRPYPVPSYPACGAPPFGMAPFGGCGVV